MKIVVNKCYGGFGLSPLAIKRYLELEGKECFFYVRDYDNNTYNKINLPSNEFAGIQYISTKDLGNSFSKEEDINNSYFYEGDIERTNSNLVKVVEELGDAANSWASKLRIVEIPDGIDWEIDEYDGIETIHEKHRSW